MSKINDRWSALSMKDRAALIDIYVKSGITDLGEIRKDYNSFGPGGDLLKAGASFIPVVGTVIDGIDLIKDPSWENAAYFAGSLASDVLGLTAIKGLAKTSKALKAAKALAETEKAAAAAKYAKLASKTEAIDKLNNAKKSARAAGQRGRAYYDDLVAKRKLQEAKVAVGKAEAQFKLASGVNLFYDTTSQGIQTLEPYVQHYNGGKLNKFETGGYTEPLYYDDTYIEPAVVKAFNSAEEYNRYQGKKGAKAVRRGMNKAANTIAEGLRYTPVVGDVMDGLEAYEEAKTGNLTKAGVLAGLTLLPNALEKPVKAVGKGLKNLRLYNRYVKDVKRFEEPVQFALKGMEENYDVLKSNFPEINTVEDARRTMDTNVSTRFDPIEFVLNEVDGHYDRKTGKIWLNAYSPTRLKQAWKSPKKAIKFMKQTATHEGVHSAIDNLNIPMSEKYEKYYRVIPGSAIDNKTKHLYTKAGREGTAWQNLPEEFIAEMNAAKYTLGEKPGSTIDSWSTPHANRSENYLSRRFSFEPGEAGELIDIYEGFGFDNGGFLHIDPFNLTVPQNEDSIIIPYKSVVTSEMNRELIQPTQDKASKFVETMYPIIEQTLVKKGYSTKNINNILRQMAFESDYGLSPRGNGYNLSGIKSWNKNDGTKHSDGFMYRNFKDYSDYADFYIDLLNNRFDAINAKDSNDYIYRLHHGKNGEKYSSNETGYMNVFNNMRSLDKAIEKYLNK